MQQDRATMYQHVETAVSNNEDLQFDKMKVFINYC